MAGATPMMQQYLELKARHPGYVLFYRMGDFFEMFFDDAEKVAPVLDIALTKRGKHAGADIPMCGVPVHQAEAYLHKLTENGFRVAVCEQMEPPEDAKRRGAKAVVRRDVVRLVTAGTLTEDALLDGRANNNLAALAEAAGDLALAWLDMSTGEVGVQALVAGELPLALDRVAPRELLLPERLAEKPDLFDALGAVKAVLVPLPNPRFDSRNGADRIAEAYGVKVLDGIGRFSRAETAALGAAIDYVALTQCGAMPALRPPVRLAAAEVMQIDPATRANLELVRTLGGERKGSVLQAIDRTRTSAGARLLAGRLAAPSAVADEINRRLDGVAFFVDARDHAGAVDAVLREVPDLQRAMSRLGVDRGGPRDLAMVRDALSGAAEIRSRLTAAQGLGLPPALAEAVARLTDQAALIDKLSRALRPDLPTSPREGGFIAAGYAPELDELRSLREDRRRHILDLEARYRDEAGVKALKVRNNNVLGYFVEVPQAHGEKLAGHEAEDGTKPFVHRQSMANAIRFTTTELADLDRRLAEAGDRAVALELALFQELAGDVKARAAELADTAVGLAEIDVAAGLATLATSEGYVRPQVDDGRAFRIAGGRHPVVEQALRREDDTRFVANACDLSDAGEAAGDDVKEGEDASASRLWLVTGPNMAGKSTFLRQNALIAIMAQAGSFVPADAARIGVVDRLFSRVGAADDLARGRSTFMVEMVETAAILNRATARSLVILDEIGRGTATFDGMSIAWACLEDLHERVGCRGLFATHYHELTQLAARLEGLTCHTVRVREWKGEVVFLYDVAPGAADRSYGVHVARLAGLPAPVVARAETILGLLEARAQANPQTALGDDLPLFRAALDQVPPPSKTAPDPAADAAVDLRAAALLARLHAVNPDELTPRAALDLLYELATAARGDGESADAEQDINH